MAEEHRLKEWLERADADMRRSYEENHAKARDPARIQQTGHAAEHAWGKLLEDWLPPQYEIAYRRYILPEVDVEDYKPRETDIVVLRPGYPKALRGQEEVLAAGVAAAFSVKLTLDPKGLRETIEEAAHVRRHTAPRLGTPRQETTLPFRYGVLAHGHNLGTHPHRRVEEIYQEADQEHSEHPRLSLDMICVANLGVWSKIVTTWMPRWNEAERLNGNLVEESRQPQTVLMDNATVHSPSSADGWPSPTDLSPLAVFISDLYSYLAQEDQVADPFYRGLLGSGTSGSGQGSGRWWAPSEVYSESVLSQIQTRLLNGRDPEWGMVY